MKRLKRLWRFRHVVAIPPGAPRLNCLAAVICLMALGILFLTFHAKPAGAGLEASARSMPRMPQMAPVPLPTDEGGLRALSSLSTEELNRRIHAEIHGSRLALQLHVALLEVGKHRIERFPDYTATFIKQERVNGGDVQDVQSIELKLRHKPFSVYMKWQEGGDVGREVLFAEGQYDDKLQVRLGGIKRKLPLLKLDPSGSTALREARHPVTEMGLLQLTELILKYRRRDLELKDGVRWEMLPDQRFMDRPCDCWVVEYGSSEIQRTYRKSITYIDRELSLPVCVRNFGWPDKDIELTEDVPLDDATLIEYYGYTDIRFDNRLPDIAFDKSNSDYQFRR
jgi:Protein of unknown function (DUF1571)